MTISSLSGVTGPPELPVDSSGIERLKAREFVVDFDGPGLDVDDHQFGRQAVHHEHDPVRSDGLAGMDFFVVSTGGFLHIVAPHRLFVRGDFGPRTPSG